MPKFLEVTDQVAARAALGVPGTYSGVSVKDYGAVGDGVTDDTTAIEAAWEASGPAHNIFFPPGDYVYNGTGLDSSGDFASGGSTHAGVQIIRGAGAFLSTIRLGASSYLMTPSTTIGTLILEDLWITGGKGAIKGTYTGVDTVGHKWINRCYFHYYTECAIAHEAIDSPLWYINGCWFNAIDDVNTIGVALAIGLTDLNAITYNHFAKNRVHIKLGDGGNNAYVIGNAFFHGPTDPAGDPRAYVWIVPTTGSTNNAGNGCLIHGNKHGAENLADGDYYILYADQAAGTSNGTKMPNLSSDSTGVVAGNIITANLFRRPGLFGVGDDYAPPMVYSTTPKVRDLAIYDNQIMNTVSYLLEYRTVPTDTQAKNSRNYFGPVIGWSDETGSSPQVLPIGPQVSNDPGAGYTFDPVQALQTRPGVVRDHGSGSSAGYAELLTAAITAFNTTNATLSNTTDALGGSDATTLNITSGGGSIRQAVSAFTVGKPVWIEFDLAQPADTPLDAVKAALVDLTNGAIHWQRTVEIPSAAHGWVTYAFSFIPRNVGDANVKLFFYGADSTDTGKVVIGRPRVYHSHERIIGGRRSTAASAATTVMGTADLANSLRNQLISTGIISGTPSSGSVTSLGQVSTIELGHASDTTISRASAGQLAVEGNPLGTKVAVPASAGATGVVGQWAAESGWLYICVATNTWERVAIASW